MITNYYTLFHLTAEIGREFSDLTISEIFTQNREELVISFRETPAVVIAGCSPSNNYLYIRKSFSRAHKNSVNLFTGIEGMKIEKAYIDPADRQICIRLADHHELVIQLFGSKSNVILADRDNIIKETFLKKHEEGTVRKKLSSRPNSPVLADTSDRQNNEGRGAESVLALIKHIYPDFGAILAKELLSRADIDGTKSVDTLSKNENSRLSEYARQLSEELRTKPGPCIYYDETVPVRFSLIPLHGYEDLTSRNFNSVSEAVIAFISEMQGEKTLKKEKDEIIRTFEHELEGIDRTLKKLAAESGDLDRTKTYEKYGKLLQAQLHLVKKGDAAAQVDNFIDTPNDLIEIPLDIHLTPAKNAERYFEKAEKSRRAAEERIQRAVGLKKQKVTVSSLLEKLEDVSTAGDLKIFIEDNSRQLSQFGFKLKKGGHVRKEEQVPFRVFTVAGGFQVWAGKSGENNDLLSTRHTAKNDLWFHARGVGGSHVVLKVGTGKGEVSKQAIEQAAGIAAYYSKMKKSKLVPVTMCEGKYVRKPKGVPAGTVAVEREKTIFAEPALPKP